MVARSSRQAQQKPHADQLLAWYDRHARVLPWRSLPHQRPDPYRVWLSEIMLQQTTVQAVKPYFEAFTLRWPHVADLAAAPVEDVMRMWAGLGYYSRARNLHACARTVVERFGGVFPSVEAELLLLPGIGVYTAAAIRAIAFGERAVVVDGNVERVITRLYRVEALMPAAKAEIRQLADGLTPEKRAGDFAQAMMDLGATICTPRNPVCGLCPYREGCEAQKMGDQETFPRKPAKTAKRTRYGAAFVLVRSDGALLVRTRPPKGLLGGMLEVPGSEWSHEQNASHQKLPTLSGMVPSWRKGETPVRHVFTHFPLELTVYRGDVPAGTPAPHGMHWISANAIPGEAFPTVFRKVFEAAGV